MATEQFTFLLLGGDGDALSEARRRLERLELSAEPLFDLPSACAPYQDRPCPHDGGLPCSCRLTALRVGKGNWTYFILVAHRHDGKTWLTIEPPEWVSFGSREASGLRPREPEAAPRTPAALREDAVGLHVSLEQARHAIADAKEAIEAGDACLEVVARLTEARRHLRSAARAAVRSHWERNRREILSAEAFGQRERAVSRLLDDVRPVALDPGFVR